MTVNTNALAAPTMLIKYAFCKVTLSYRFDRENGHNIRFQMTNETFLADIGICTNENPVPTPIRK